MGQESEASRRVPHQAVEKMVVGAAVLAVVAAFLPWASAFGITAAGIQGDGVITAGAGVFGLVVYFVRRRGRTA